MKIPFLIFLVSGFASLQLEPAFTRAAELIWHVVVRDVVPPESAAPFVKAGDQEVISLKEELADVQLDLMKVLETGHDATAQLESREAGLKYALRAGQIRRDESASRHQTATRLPVLAQHWRAFGSKMPRL
jgi:hypothetical protein